MLPRPIRVDLFQLSVFRCSNASVSFTYAFSLHQSNPNDVLQCHPLPLADSAAESSSTSSARWAQNLMQDAKCFWPTHIPACCACCWQNANGFMQLRQRPRPLALS
jgi:hypothetical protein